MKIANRRWCRRRCESDQVFRN